MPEVLAAADLPARWLLALDGEKVIETAGAVAAGRVTRLARTSGEPELSVRSAGTFMETIAVHGIVADPDDRRELIVTGLQDLIYPDGRIDLIAEAPLLDEITDLVEQPVPLLATFDEEFLELPAEIVAAVLRERRLIPVRDADGDLLPMVVTVADGPVDVEVVRGGNEAALKARLSAIAERYREDREAAPRPYSREAAELAQRLAEEVGQNSATLRRAARWAGTDAGTALVRELPQVSGVLAGEYALAAGEPRDVARAAREATLTGALPRTIPGALLAIAHRLTFGEGTEVRAIRAAFPELAGLSPEVSG